MVDGNKNKIKTTTYVAVSGGKEGTMRSLLREGSWKSKAFGGKDKSPP